VLLITASKYASHTKTKTNAANNALDASIRLRFNIKIRLASGKNTLSIGWDAEIIHQTQGEAIGHENI
jgi:hypothetical protein